MVIHVLRICAAAAEPVCRRWLSQQFMPELRAQPGLVALHAGRLVGAEAEFVLISIWRDENDLAASSVGHSGQAAWSPPELPIETHSRIYARL
jgi:quinol monooxygenase YgiN